jgi:hypothetical protein
MDSERQQVASSVVIRLDPLQTKMDALYSTPTAAPSYTPTQATASAEEALSHFEGYEERVKTLATDVFKAHKQALGTDILH